MPIAAAFLKVSTSLGRRDVLRSIGELARSQRKARPVRPHQPEMRTARTRRAQSLEATVMPPIHQPVRIPVDWAVSLQAGSSQSGRLSKAGGGPRGLTCFTQQGPRALVDCA